MGDRVRHGTAEEAGAERARQAFAGVLEPRTEQLDQGVRRSVLSDGTIVLSERMDSVRSVAAGFWVRRGTAHETRSVAGAAHLLEHMVFKGTSRRAAREIAATIERTGGSIDAYTTHEHTAFEVRLPAHHLAQGLDVLSDMTFHPALREQDLELERSVVLEEIARVHDTPDDLVFDLHADFLYDGHPYGAPILGTADSVAALTIEDLRRVHAGSYDPANLIVAAAGLVDHDELVGRVVDLIPESGVTEGEEGVAPIERTAVGRRTASRPGGQQVHIVVGGRGVEYGSPLRYAVAVVGQALGGGMSSRLFQRIREEHGLAYSVYSFQSSYARGGHVGAYLGTRPEHAEEARETLLDQLRLLSEQGLEPQELGEVREQIKGQIMLSLEAPAARMHRLAASALYGEPYRTLDELATRIDAIDSARAAEAASLFDPEGVAILELWPA